MKETYSIVDKRKTPCIQPSGYQRDKKIDYNFIAPVLCVDIKKLDM